MPLINNKMLRAAIEETRIAVTMVQRVSDLSVDAKTLLSAWVTLDFVFLQMFQNAFATRQTDPETLNEYFQRCFHPREESPSKLDTHRVRMRWLLKPELANSNRATPDKHGITRNGRSEVSVGDNLVL